MAWRDTRAGRFLRTRLLPTTIWLATVVVVGYLWHDVGSRAPILGFAHGVETKVSATVQGRVSTMAVDVGQEVIAGQIIAALDPRDMDAEILVEESELIRLDAAIRAASARASQRSLATARGFDQAGDSARVAQARATADMQVKVAELKTLSAQRKEMAAMVARGLVVKRDLAALELRHATLTRRVAAARKTVTLLRSQSASARSRRKALPQNSVALAVAPLQAEKKVCENRLERLRKRRAGLVLRAPMGGRVSEIMKRVGEVVSAGQPLVTVVSKKASRVIACVYEKQAMDMRVGRKVTLYPRGWSDRTFKGHVMAIGPIVDQVPARCRPQRRQRAWGRDMFIQMDEAADLVPGLAFNVSLEKKPLLHKYASAAPVERGKDRPSLMSVPAPLKSVSRFEPSGLIWVPRLARYVVVSDDTGHKGRNKHVPWLFLMSMKGRVDPKPLALNGVEKVNDLESIAQGADSALYVLSSQSYSKKGKRKGSRQLFARLEPWGLSYRRYGSVRLAELLDAAGSETLSRLGISDTRELDIEGMTAYAGGLLLGLKSPLSADGKAIIWQMKHPARLVASGRLSEAGLGMWGKVKLSVKADGRQVPGGISELLALPDGSLVVASTASNINPTSQDGTLWRVSRTEEGPLNQRLVRTFPGQKPEGLALSPRAGRLTIAFDAGPSIPSWVEIPWPR